MGVSMYMLLFCLTIEAAAPIHYAILNGDSKTGVTIMHMDDGLDTGDIIDIVEIDILPGETTGQLFERIAELGGETIVPVLTRWVNGGNCGYTTR